MEIDKLRERFLSRMKEHYIDLHSFVLMHENEVLCENYTPPFNADFPHRIYSATKSFVAAAVLKMADEGQLRLDDKICKLFENRFDTSGVSPYLGELTVRDTLMMAACYSTPVYGANDRDWLRKYFSAPATHPPGTLFTMTAPGLMFWELLSGN